MVLARDLGPEGLGRALRPPSRDFRTLQPLLLIVTAASVLTTVLWSISRPMYFGNDFTTYVHLSEFFVGQRLPHSIVFVKQPGYPLLLIAAGVLTFQSFAGILFLQAIMAASVPLIAYRAVAWVSQRMAFIVALAIIFSLTSLIHSRAIMTEQTFIFLFVLLAYFVLKFNSTRAPIDFWAMVLTCLALNLVRPSANLIGYLVLGLTLLLGREHLRRILVAALLIISVNAAWSFFVATRVTPEAEGSFVQRLAFVAFSYAYQKGAELPPEQRFHNEPGAQVRASIAHFARSQQSTWGTHEPARYFGAFRGQPTEFENALLSASNRFHMRAVVDAIDSAYSAQMLETPPTRVQFDFALQTFRTHPLLFASFFARYGMGSTISTAGPKLFYDGYILGRFALPWNYSTTQPQALFAPENGPASKRLIEQVEIFLQDYPQFRPLDQHDSDVQRVVQKFLSEPDTNAWAFMWHALIYMVGPLETGELFNAAAWESFNARPTVVLALLDNLATVMFGPIVRYTAGGRVIMLPRINTGRLADPGLNEPLRSKVRAHVVWPQAGELLEGRGVSYVYGFLYSVLKPLIHCTIMVTILFVLASRFWWAGLVLMLALLYHHTVTAVFAMWPDSRYTDEVFPAAAVLAGIGVAVAARVLRTGQLREAMPP